MKIEMCEQLVAAWLRYCKGCQIVQTNWTPTPDEVDGVDPEEVKRYVNICNVTLEDKDVDLFGHSREQQIVTQCEIDVIGVHVEAGKVDKLYLIDTAFHINGLNYRNNTSRVLKKFLRAALISRLFFRDIDCEVIFASPFCRDSQTKKIEGCLAKLDTPELACPNIRYSLLVNNGFVKEISQPLKDMMADIADDNALYIRALQLDGKCGEVAGSAKHAAKHRGAASEEHRPDKTPRGGNKKTVLSGLRGLQAAGVLQGELLQKLCSAEYTRNTFKVSSFPLLAPADSEMLRSYPNRFYPEVLEIDGTQYRVCSQWIPERLERFIHWLEILTPRPL